MRRTAKPFTIEVKRGGRVRRNASNSDTDMPGTSTVGSDLRFRDAERMFRNGVPHEDEAPVAPSLDFEAPSQVSIAPAPERRILPDLVAEAALSEQIGRLQPEQPRRRGRPPKDRTGELPGPPARRGRPKRVEPLPEVQTDIEELVVASPSLAPILLDLAASARRRAARDTAHLPRGERWKRRLPKACW